MGGENFKVHIGQVSIKWRCTVHHPDDCLTAITDLLADAQSDCRVRGGDLALAG